MQTHSITTQPDQATQIAQVAQVGQIANEAARAHVMTDYATRKSANTLKAQRTDLQTFCDYMAQVGKVDLSAADLQTDPATWQGVTFGLVEGFVKWMLAEGYAIGSINRKLSTVKTYCRLAAKAGTIDTQDHAMIRMVQGYSRKEGKRIDERRPETRILAPGRPAKKADHTSLTVEDVNALKFNPETPQGIRDSVMVCFLADHGLRVGELAGLQIDDIDLAAGQFKVYRSKVDRTQTHNLTRHTRQALQAYVDEGHAPQTGTLLRGSRKSGNLTDQGMSARAISKRVKSLGEEIGVDTLSPHDLRHYWATRAVKAGTDAFALRDAGGWSDLSMPSRYVEEAQIANEGVRL